MADGNDNSIFSRINVAAVAITAAIGAGTAFLTLYTQANEIIGAATKGQFAPVGTIISSTLNEEEFAKQVGENIGNSPDKRVWILSDGRQVLNSKYATTTGRSSVPDLRNMFLRGVDPNNRTAQRLAGDKQDFSTARPNRDFTGATNNAGEHQHSGVMNSTNNNKLQGGNDQGLKAPYVTDTASAGTHSHVVTINGGGDEETRPVNVAVYFYIKVN